MSIILKGLDKTTANIGSDNGFPVGIPINVDIKNGSFNNIIVTWDDPEDIILEGITIATWKSTIAVIKNGSIPESIADGKIIINNTQRNTDNYLYYNGDGCPLVEDDTYYIRFYTLSSDGVYNNSIESIYSFTYFNVSSTLEDNSWEVISKVADAGLASKYWQIGDTKTVDLGRFGVNTFEIIGFNHDEPQASDLSDPTSTERISITFGLVNVYLTGDSLLTIDGYFNKFPDSLFYSSVGHDTVVRINNAMYEQLQDQSLKNILKPARKSYFVSTTYTESDYCYSYQSNGMYFAIPNAYELAACYDYTTRNPIAYIESLGYCRQYERYKTSIDELAHKLYKIDKDNDAYSSTTYSTFIPDGHQSGRTPYYCTLKINEGATKPYTYASYNTGYGANNNSYALIQFYI